MFFDVDLTFFDVDLSFFDVDLSFAPSFHRARTVRTPTLNGSFSTFARTHFVDMFYKLKKQRAAAPLPSRGGAGVGSVISCLRERYRPHPQPLPYKGGERLRTI